MGLGNLHLSFVLEICEQKREILNLLRCSGFGCFLNYDILRSLRPCINKISHTSISTILQIAKNSLDSRRRRLSLGHNFEVWSLN